MYFVANVGNFFHSTKDKAKNVSNVPSLTPDKGLSGRKKGKGLINHMTYKTFVGVEGGTRTHDIQNHNLTL